MATTAVPHTTTTAFHESLPYIDPELTLAQRSQAESQIATELSTSGPPPPSSDILPGPPRRDPQFTPLMTAELARVAAKEPLNAIDLSRYEAQEPLASAGGDATTAQLDALADTLRKAYTSRTYLAVRNENLELLDQWGRNAWLVGNAALEDELRALERDLAATKAQIDVLTVARRRQQEQVAGEMRGLEEQWRRGVGRVLEAEVAVERLRREVLVEMERRAKEQ